MVTRRFRPFTIASTILCVLLGGTASAETEPLIITNPRRPVCDPAAVKQARAQAAAATPLALLRRLPAESIDALEEETDLIAKHELELQRAWSEMLERQPPVPPGQRARALAALATIDAPNSAVRWYDAILACDDEAQIEEVLTAMIVAFWGGRTLPGAPPELAPRLERWLLHENREIRWRAASLWRACDLPRKYAIAERVLSNSEFGHDALLYRLAEVGSELVLTVVSKRLESPDEHHLEEFRISKLEKAAYHPALRDGAISLALKLAERTPSAVTDRGTSLARDLVARYAGPDSVCQLARWVSETLRYDTDECVAALARLCGENLESTLAECGLDEAARKRVLERLRAATEPARRKADTTKEDVLAKSDPYSQGQELVSYFGDHRPSRVPAWALPLLDRLDVPGALEIMWQLQGRSLADLLRKLHEAGLVERLPSETELATIDTDNEDIDLPQRLIWALEKLGAVVSYDLETIDGYPVLIDKFQEVAGGAWTAECALHVDGRVQFVSGDCVYGFDVRPVHDENFIDCDSLLIAINTSLERQGRPERFVPVRTSEYAAVYFFGEPDAIEKGLASCSLSIGSPNAVVDTADLVKKIARYAAVEDE